MNHDIYLADAKTQHRQKQRISTPGDPMEHKQCHSQQPGDTSCRIIRIYYELVDRIDNSDLRATAWHHGLCRVMPNSDPSDIIV